MNFIWEIQITGFQFAFFHHSIPGVLESKGINRPSFFTPVHSSRSNRDWANHLMILGVGESSNLVVLLFLLRLLCYCLPFVKIRCVCNKYTVTDSSSSSNRCHYFHFHFFNSTYPSVSPSRFQWLNQQEKNKNKNSVSWLGSYGTRASNSVLMVQKKQPREANGVIFFPRP